MDGNDSESSIENPNIISPQMRTSSYLSNHYPSRFEESQDPDNDADSFCSFPSPTVTDNLFDSFVQASFVEEGDFVDETFVEETPDIDWISNMNPIEDPLENDDSPDSTINESNDTYDSSLTNGSTPSKFYDEGHSRTV